MASHALWLNKCTSHFHEVDGRCIETLHQLLCGSSFGLHPHLQQNVGGAHATYSSGFEHSTVAQALFQLGKMLFWHEQGPIPGLHC
jgi:hypothetical protein